MHSHSEMKWLNDLTCQVWHNGDIGATWPKNACCTKGDFLTFGHNEGAKGKSDMIDDLATLKLPNPHSEFFLQVSLATNPNEVKTALAAKTGHNDPTYGNSIMTQSLQHPSSLSPPFVMTIWPLGGLQNFLQWCDHTCMHPPMHADGQK